HPVGQLAVAVGLGRGLPDSAAGEGIDLGVARQTLLGGPVARAAPFRWALGHGRNFIAGPQRHLFWAMAARERLANRGLYAGSIVRNETLSLRKSRRFPQVNLKPATPAAIAASTSV